MTIQDVDGALWTPWLPAFTDDSVPFFIYVQVDQPGDRAAVVLRATKDGTLNGFEWTQFNSGIVSGSVVRYSFQSLDSENLPNGTGTYFRLATPSFPPVTTTWEETGILSTDGTDTGTKLTVTRGQMIACVIEWQSFASAPDRVTLGYAKGKASTSNNVYQCVTGTWSLADSGGTIPSIALKYDDGTYSYQPGIIPSLDILEQEISAANPQQEWGMAFRFTAPVRLGGAIFRYYLHNLFDNPVDAHITLYDKDFYTILEQVDILLDSNRRYQNFVFSQEHVLDGNEVYRAVISLNYAAGDDGAFVFYELDNTNLLSVIDGGARFYLTSRSGAVLTDESWEDEITKRPLISLMITGIDHDTSGGSGVVEES